MIHLLYLIGFALFVSAAFGVYIDGSPREKAKYGIKTFVQFVVISLAIAWVLYFLPW